MKQPRGIGLHVLFWTVYFGIHLFNDLYMSSSFTLHPSLELFAQSVSAQLLILTIKVPAVYYVLYSIIPRWVRAGSKLKLLVEGVIVFCLLLVCYRGLVHYVIRPYIFQEPSPNLSGLQYVARFFYSLLDMLQVTGIAAAIKLFRLRIAAMRQEKLLIREKLQSEMQHLRAQINPHFLFNSLNSIYALARTRSQDTPDVVMRLSTILRYMLYASGQKLISLEEELRITRDYIELQQIRFGDKVHVHIDADLDNPKAMITPQVLLPLVENAFKHGASDVTGHTDLRLHIRLRNDQLHIELQNTLGDPAPKQEGNAGIGLANMRRRLQLLYRDHSLLYEPRGNTFAVELNINLASYADLELPDR